MPYYNHSLIIQNRNKSLYKYKYFLLLILLSVTFFFNIYQTQCGLLNVIIGIVTDKLGLTNITDEVFEGTFSLLSKGFAALLEWLLDAMMVSFSPSEALFTKYLGANGISMFHSVSSYIGGALAFLILMSSLLAIIMSGINGNELRDDPIHLLIRFLIAIILIYFSHGIMTFFLEYANDIWQNSILTSVGDIVSGKSTKISSEDFSLIEGSGFDVSILGTKISKDTQLATRVFGWFWVLVSLIMLIPIIKNFIRLYVEIVERYIVVILMVLFFSVAVATYVSRNTENILRSYMRMFSCQMFLMLINAVFLKGFILALSSNLIVGSLSGYIFGIAYLRSAQRLDSYMASMGLNVAQTGASLLDAMGGGFKAVTGSFRNMNNARKSGGELVSGIGLATGNMNMISAGKVMSAGIKDIGSIGKSGLNGFGSPINAIRTAGENGVTIKAGNVAPSTVVSALEQYLSDSSNKNAQNVVKGIDHKDILAGLNSQGNGKFKFNQVDTSNLNKGVVVKGVTENGTAFTGTLSDTNGIQLSPETGIFINADNSTVANEKVTLDDLGPNATAADLSMHFGVEDVLPNNGEDMPLYAAQNFGNGNIGLYDKENCAIGAVSNGEFIPNAMYDSEKKYEQQVLDFAQRTNDSVTLPRYDTIPDFLSKDLVNKYTGGEVIGDISKTEDSGIQTCKVRTDHPDSKGDLASTSHDYQMINMGSHPEVTPKGSDRVINVKYGDMGSGRVLLREVKAERIDANDQPLESYSSYQKAKEQPTSTKKKGRKNTT